MILWADQPVQVKLTGSQQPLNLSRKAKQKVHQDQMYWWYHY